MCTVCGCSEDSEKDHHHHGHHYGQNSAGLHIAGMSQEKIIQVEMDILAKNNSYAANNRAFFLKNGVLTLNLVSSPGSGKTSILEKSLIDLYNKFNLRVIEGDQQTTQDADRINKTGVQAIQVNTGKGCHLDAHMVGHTFEELNIQKNSLLFIENVGNLVCPSAFDLGEYAKVVILSVTEGEDKPLKYPDMFAASDLMILNKIDLLPHLNFDVDKCISYAKKINPKIQILQLSATSGEGMNLWYKWLEAHMNIVQVLKNNNQNNT